MIHFKKHGTQFNYRVGGVAIEKGRVLLQTTDNQDYWTLPGGRVEFNETSSDGLEREMDEEIGVAVRVERLLWVVENFFEERGTPFHELAFYYLMHFSADWLARHGVKPFEGHEKNSIIQFEWKQVDELDNVRVYPDFLRAGLRNLPATPAHVVHRDE